MINNINRNSARDSLHDSLDLGTHMAARMSEDDQLLQIIDQTAIDA